MTGVTSKPQPLWKRFTDSESLAAMLAQTILDEAELAIARQGSFFLVLAGGSTPRHVYARLAAAEADWRNWHIWFGDERCYPAGHPDRNDSMADTTLLQHVPIPRANIHRVPDSSPEIAAADYAASLPRNRLFDLTLLGMGEDGHTASLFPGHEWGEAGTSPAALAIGYAPKPPAARVTLSAERLGQSSKVIFIVTGFSKADAVLRWWNGEKLPVTAINAARIEIWLDQAAAKKLPANP